MKKVTKLRTDVILTEAEQDIIDFLLASDIPRATHYKIAMRAYMQRKEDEQFDERVKRLLSEALAERGEVVSAPVKVESKKRLGFGAKKAQD